MFKQNSISAWKAQLKDEKKNSLYIGTLFRFWIGLGVNIGEKNDLKLISFSVIIVRLRIIIKNAE